jgi:hypothetical protein
MWAVFANTVKLLTNLATLTTNVATLDTTVNDIPLRVIPKKFTSSSQTTSHTLVASSTTYFQVLSISGRGILLYLLSNTPTGAGKFKVVIDGVETEFTDASVPASSTFSDYRLEYHTSLVVYATYPGFSGASSVVCSYKILTES